MAMPNNEKRYTGLLAAGMVVCAAIARVLGRYGILPMPFGLVHTVICIGLCIAWGISVNRRIVLKTVRKYMLGVSAMAVFWFVTRSVKYYFTADLDISRYLWYSYYVPMLFIPLFVVLIALSLGKPDDYLPSKSVWLLTIPALLSLLVLTNDLHQLVFTFPEATVWSDNDYGYGSIYCMIWACELICTLVAFVIMLRKCRLTRRREYLPAFLILLANLYSILYVTAGAESIINLLAGDMVMVLSLLIIGILESAIQCGLIQTNTSYAELFEVGAFGAQIADSELNILYAPSNAPALNKEAMRKACSGTLPLDRNTVLKAAPIVGGHVFWQEDITDLTATLEKMEENRAAIAENNLIEEESLRVKRKLHALREKNRLYDLLQSKIAPQIDMLSRLFSQYNTQTDNAKRRSLLGKIAVVGAYIKRCGNLLFIGEKSERIDTAELSMCMEESFANLSLMKIECAMDIPGGHSISTKDAIRVYDIFEQITESAIDDLRSVWLKARVLEDEMIFRIEVECDTSLAALSELADSCSREEGIWSFALRIGKAGEMP